MTSIDRRITYRDASWADIQSFYGERFPQVVCRAWVAVIDDKPLGIGGIVHIGEKRFAFSTMTDELRSDPKSVVRCLRVLMGVIDSIGEPVYAIPDKFELTAPTLLKKLGWVETDDVISGIEQGTLLVRSPKR